jgi:hypothetical protein
VEALWVLFQQDLLDANPLLLQEAGEIVAGRCIWSSMWMEPDKRPVNRFFRN